MLAPVLARPGAPQRTTDGVGAAPPCPACLPLFCVVFAACWALWGTQAHTPQNAVGGICGAVADVLDQGRRGRGKGLQRDLQIQNEMQHKTYAK